MTDLAEKIVEALFDMGSESGGLVKSRAIERVRQVMAAHQPVAVTPTTTTPTDFSALSLRAGDWLVYTGVDTSVRL